MNKNIFNVAVIFVLSIIVGYMLLKNYNINLIYQQLLSLNAFWIVISILCMFLYWLFEALSLHIITGFFDIKKKIFQSFLVTMVGQFFNSITPFSSGGQPAQVFFMTRYGIDLGKSGSIVVIKFIAYQTVLTLYSFFVIVSYFPFFNTKIPLLFTMTFFGLSVHCSLIFITLFFSYNQPLCEKIMKIIFLFLDKIKILKLKEDTQNNILNSLSTLQYNIKLLKSNIALFVKSSILIFFQLTFFFSIPFCIYKSFGFTGTSFFALFAASVFVATVISIVPLPGAAGGAEGSFYLFFSPFINSTALITAILIWRLITYYSCIGVGGLLVALFDKSPKNDNIT